MSRIKANVRESLGYLLFRNPVLVLGLVVGQLAAGDTSLINAAALSVTYFFVTVPVLVFASAIGKRFPVWFKAVSYALLAAAMLIPAYFISGSFSATIFDSAGIYPALLAVSTVPVVYSEKMAEKQTVAQAFFNGIFITLGFALTAAILGAAREFLSGGSLWGIKISDSYFPAANLPFWGFIFLGFMAAAVNLAAEHLKKPGKTPETEEGKI